MMSKINFDYVGNRMIVELYAINAKMRSNPVNTLELLVDTGAFITILNKDTADESQYPIIEPKGCILTGFSEKGLVCDLRVINTLIFGNYEIKDAIIATPSEDGVLVTEILGMNILENFDFDVSLSNSAINLVKRAEYISHKPKYKCGSVFAVNVDEFNRPYS